MSIPQDPVVINIKPVGFSDARLNIEYTHGYNHGNDEKPSGIQRFVTVFHLLPWDPHKTFS